MPARRLSSILAAVIVVVPLSVSCLSCALGPKPVMAKNVLEGTCGTPRGVVDPASVRPSPDAPSLPAQIASERGYTKRALDTARAIGALPAVERLAEAQTRGAPQAEIADLRGQLNDAIVFATLDLSSVIAHIQCEEGRASQIAADLRGAEETQTRRLTAYSLTVSAVTAIAAGVLAIKDDNQTPTSVVGITGGVVGGVLGFGTLAVHRTTPFPHPRNILGQIWRGAQHPDFPESIWAYLTWPQFARDGEATVRDGLLTMWRQSGRLGDSPSQPDPTLVALYFGEGGVYDAKGLDDRSSCLSELREATGVMTYDLQRLAREAGNR